jgi:hypothetical protein
VSIGGHAAAPFGDNAKGYGTPNSNTNRKPKTQKPMNLPSGTVRK